MTLVELLQYVNDALFVGLAGICCVQWRRQAGRAAAWLAATFGTLAGVVLVGLVLAANPAVGTNRWVEKLLIAALLLFPYLLFRVTASLDHAARRTEQTMGALAGALLVWTLLLPAFPQPGQPRPSWLSAYLVGLLLEWTLISLVVAVKLWRAGQHQPTAARRRMRGLSLAATGLSLAVVVSGLAPPTPPQPLAVATQLVTLASALLFYLAFAPPKLLRNAWLASEQQTLRQAMADLNAVTRVQDVATCLLPYVRSMVGATGAALVDGAGLLVGSDGHTPALQDGTQGSGAMRLPLSTGTLLVWASPYAPLFGRQELELLQALGSLAELALERLRTAERDSELAVLVDASGDAIVSTGLDGTIRSWNPAAEAIYGHPAGHAVGQALSTLARPDAADELPQLLRQVGQGERVRLETRHLRADGVAIDVALTAAPVRDRAGAVVGASLVARDITDSRQAEEELRAAKEAADRANQAKSEYLSRMSHELRTPLNAILGFSQLLELEELTDDQRESLDHVLSAARHLLGLINEVLDIAAIEAGRLPLSLEPVAVAEVVGETISLIRPLADQHGILLAATTPGCATHVLGDRQRLKQILLNLLANAVKYNRQGGNVQLHCQQTPDQRLQIRVSDTGVGIPAHSMERLFVPFERLTDQQQSIEGAGLGLPLSKRLAEAMGGTLQVTTVADQGSTFWVELPLTEGPLQHEQQQPTGTTAQPPQPEPEQPTPALTVLYIEDNLSNLQLVERVLQRRPGVKLISAMRPQLGLDLAGEHRPDLVLLDLHLPDMPGEEVLRRLHANPKTADVPVVILSADARPGQTTRLLAQGARAFLTKPLDVKQLLDLLDTITNQQQPTTSGA